jgi:HEAT repeat protein
LLVVVMLISPLAGAAEPPGPPTVDQAWAQLKTYDYGQDDTALHVLERHIGGLADPAARTQVATQLAALLAAPASSPAAKTFACKQLVVVGTETQVPVLAKLLDNPETADLARYTLQAIPGEASLAALRGALGRLTGLPLVGTINSLALRGDPAAVPVLAKLLDHADAQVAAAAAEALGKIATAPAAAALLQARAAPAAAVTLHNARLQCAERLAVAGDAATAAGLCEPIWSSKAPTARRLGALAVWSRVAPEKATPAALDALAAEEPLVQATAVQLLRQLKGPQVTAALVARLEKLDGPGQVLLLGMLADRGDRAAAEAVARRMDDRQEPVRVAAIEAMARLGDAALVERLMGLAVSAGGEPAQAARRTLVQLTAAGVEARLLALAADGAAAQRAEAIRVLAGRGSTAAAGLLLNSATDADGAVRAAAFDALAALALPDTYGQLVERLTAAASNPADLGAAERAVLATGGRVDDPTQRVAPLIAATDKAAPPAKVALLRVLGGFGGPEALAAVRVRLSDGDTLVRDAAVRALANWPDAAAAADLLKLAQASESATHRTLALRGYLRLAGEVKEGSARLKMLAAIRPIATTAQAKRLLLAALAEAADPGALHVTAELLDDAEVQAEAAVATLKIGRAVLRSDPTGVRVVLRKLLDSKDQTLREQAAALDEEAQKVPSPEAIQQALRHDQKRSDAYKAALAKRAPQGYRLACYLDCGPDVVDGAKDKPFLRLLAGAPYVWNDAARSGELRLVTIAFDGQQVVFEATGLSAKRSYQIGFTWWDFDHATRVQSVWVSPGQGRETRLLDKTRLPSGANGEAPAEKTLPVPAEVTAKGTLRILFRNEAQPNAVVSELWLWESDAEGR